MNKWMFMPIMAMSLISGCNNSGSDSNTATIPPSPSVPSPQSFNMLPIAGHTTQPKMFTFQWSKSENATNYTLCEKDVTEQDNCKPLQEQAASVDDVQRLDYFFPQLLTASNISDKHYFIKATNSSGSVLSAEKTIDLAEMSSAVGYLKAINIDAHDHFGKHIAISADGSTIAISASHDDAIDNTKIDAGAVYVYKKQENGWSDPSYLTASNVQAGDNFGISVAINDNGTALIVGAYQQSTEGLNTPTGNNYYNGTGAAYIFDFVDDQWVESGFLKAPNQNSGDNFGVDVSISGDGQLVAVGAAQEASISQADPDNNIFRGAGAAYVFKKEGDSWSQNATYLKSLSPNFYTFFGARLALSSDGRYLAVASILENSGLAESPTDNSGSGSGAVFVFEQNNGSWGTPQYLKASNIGASDNFGMSLSFSGDGSTLAIGAPNEDSNNAETPNDDGEDVGAVYLFNKNNDNDWMQSAYIKPSTIQNNARFSSVSLSNDGSILAVGSPLASVGGEVELFKKTNDVWQSQFIFKSKNPDANNNFGEFVKLSASGNSLMVSEYSDDSSTDVASDGDKSAQDAGAVYIY